MFRAYLYQGMSKKLPQKRFMRHREARVPMPDLIAPQVASFRTFVNDGLKALFKEFSPINDYSKKKFELEFVSFELGEPKVDEYGAKNHKQTFDAPLKANIRLINKGLGTKKEQSIFLADMPIMTDHGTFIINGVERVVVPQLARSFGVFFTTAEVRNKTCFGAKIIPARGAWIEIESEADGAIFVKIDRKRKFPITTLLRILGASFDRDMLTLFERVPGGKAAIQASLEKDTAETAEKGYIEIYRRLRDGDLATPDTAREYVQGLFSSERYDLSYPGRHRFNQRFNLPMDKESLSRYTLNLDDVVQIVRHIIELNQQPGAQPDDIDHLGFRRVRQIGELLEARVRVGL